ncbi:2TM domain-containing protein [Lacinutrix neustonica]|uniref:2TM domain-containing protein n=1 Tax=Lacinutrix neustonica TaxID=2980107 RepID=A0A9E8MZN9_9FLAO|nr:2TM domain-containing protein [Lacinutrix neustonica]WAC03209.1 2TM domain-containing protein [Lacinutrix neustonica]
MRKYEIEPFEEADSKQNFEREEAYLRAKKKVDNIRGFYVHLVVYLLINIFLIVTITSNSDQPLFSFGTFSTPIFWGIGLFFHFLSVFGKNLIFGKAWEQRQIDKYMDDDKRRWE